jgi:glycosyltransferase involved in cell wall biosynthesis
VLLPVRDEEPYLGGCLESLSAQTLADFEVVALDDGSTDATSGRKLGKRIHGAPVVPVERAADLPGSLALGAVSGPEVRARVREIAAGLGLAEGKDFVAVA